MRRRLSYDLYRMETSSLGVQNVLFPGYLLFSATGRIFTFVDIAALIRLKVRPK